jgi:hypothetical protein
MMPRLAVPRPPQAASLQAATRLPVRATASVELAIRCQASQERTLAIFRELLALPPVSMPVESDESAGSAGR